jgi:hypothetical protein
MRLPAAPLSVFFSLDGLHPSDQGYARRAEAMLAVVEQAIREWLHRVQNAFHVPTRSGGVDFEEESTPPPEKHFGS